MKLVVTTSTLPVDEQDVVPGFVLDQVQVLSQLDVDLEIYVLVPHHAYGEPVPDRRDFPTHHEVRFHYFFPHSMEKLSGRGILPALKSNPLRYALIPFFLWGQRRALKKLCREIQPDLIYAHWFMPQAVVAAGIARRLNIPLMFTSHASDVSVLKKLPFSRWLVRRCLNVACRFSAVSQRTADKMIEFFPPDEWDRNFAGKLSIIPMGTSIAAVSSQGERLQTNEPLENVAPIGQPYLLFLGRLSEKKGIDYLLDAYAELVQQQRVSHQRLVIAGEGELESRLKEKVIRLGLGASVDFAGFVNGASKSELLAAADMVILPSIIDEQGDSEGMPVVLMEALSMSRRVIATTVSGAEEVLTRNSGVLVEPENASALTSAIASLNEQSAEERHAMETSAFDLSKQFEWVTVGQRYHAMLHEAVGCG
ncbi:MAG: glycosyltransferase [Granulosicoccus sp.]|nr:glycosyltransferase [Granulosicoccus sp.]